MSEIFLTLAVIVVIILSWYNGVYIGLIQQRQDDVIKTRGVVNFFKFTYIGTLLLIITILILIWI